jgi:hypothetical protein
MTEILTQRRKRTKTRKCPIPKPLRLSRICGVLWLLPARPACVGVCELPGVGPMPTLRVGEKKLVLSAPAERSGDGALVLMA